MASKKYFINGVAELLILSILEKDDTYIYDIKKIISEMSGDRLPISQNTIYAAAYKMEDEGKITEYSKRVGKKRTRVYYHLEESGKKYLEKLSSDYNSVASGVAGVLDYVKDGTGRRKK